RILHIATHGFFLDDGCIVGQISGLRGIGGMSPSSTASLPDGAAEGNPLRLSGLALAGANHRSTTDGNDQDDGILTADEIAVMNLAGTEWAVLSACDTGRGHVQVGEGVVGLRRAFQIAGTASV